MRKICCFLLALALCIGLLPAFSFVADAAEFEYVYDSTGKYIYNWGVREETATSLSPNAEDFYTGNNTYDLLSAYSGGTGTSDAPDSQLYAALHDLMKRHHSYETSYGATRDLYQYTDCQNSGKDSKVISSFYSGADIGPAWDSGKTWNREHTWPNSKGLGGNDENDIMMLRPTAKSENGARGNKAYGKSAGYYNPNMESDGTHDLRGDVARIFLYVYVRWENVDGNGNYTTWGTSGVMESLDVLLEWMEADPVDTWEMGRNDSVESITGTRNVFVDYPEFAWLLFGAEIPEGMVTPSGKASEEKACTHTNTEVRNASQATCSAAGFTGDTYCADCGTLLTNGQTIPATGDHKNTELRNAADATCGVEGYTGDTYCADCDTLLTNGEAISATGQHSFGDWVVDAEGNTQKRTCQVCGHEEEESISSCEHDFGAWETVIAPNNGKPGIQSRTCKLCGEKETLELECLHVRTEVRNKQEAGCKDGYTGDAYCEDCGALIVKGEVVAATGQHVFGAWITLGDESFRQCTLCNYRVLEDKDDKDNKTPALSNYQIMMIVVFTAAVGVIVAYVILMKKHWKTDKKTNKKKKK